MIETDILCSCCVVKKYRDISFIVRCATKSATTKNPAFDRQGF